MRVWCRERSDGRHGRPGRPKRSNLGRHVRASRTRRARRRRGIGQADGGLRTDRAGSPCPWARRTRTSSPPPSTASVDARRPAHHGSGSRPSPSRGAAAAQPPTPAPTRSGVSSLRYALSGAPCLSLCLLPYHFSFCFLKHTETSRSGKLLGTLPLV